MLVDGMIAVLIVAIGLVAISLAFTKATGASIMSSDKTQATYLAKESLEYFKKYDGSTTPVTQDIVNQAVSNTDFPAVTSGFSRTISATQPNNANTKLRQLNVVVTWTDSNSGQTDNVTLNSYYYTK
jgi:type II secretory pathway pseudopilin PulG